MQLTCKAGHFLQRLHNLTWHYEIYKNLTATSQRNEHTEAPNNNWKKIYKNNNNNNNNRNLPDSSQQHFSDDAGWIDFLAVLRKSIFPWAALSLLQCDCPVWGLRRLCRMLCSALLCSALQVSLLADRLRELAEGKKEGVERKWSHIRKPPNPCPLFSPSSRDGDGARLSSGTGRDDI